MAKSGAVQVEGLSELRKELRKLESPREWAKELSKAHRDLGKRTAAWASGEAAGMGGVQSHFAGAIRGYGSAASARVGIGNPSANAGFWGANKRTGWNAGNTTANQPKWVGAGWEVGGAGGPYAINSAIAAHMDEIIETYADGVEDITSRAFPN